MILETREMTISVPIHVNDQVPLALTIAVGQVGDVEITQVLGSATYRLVSRSRGSWAEFNLSDLLRTLASSLPGQPGESGS